MLTSDGFSVWLQTSGSILGSRPHATWLKVGWVAKIWKSRGFLFGNEEMIRSDGGFVFLTRKGLRKGLIGVSKSRKDDSPLQSFFVAEWRWGSQRPDLLNRQNDIRGPLVWRPR